MSQGVILLVFLAVLAALAFAAGRRRLGLPVTGRMLLVVAAGFALAELALWAGPGR